MKIIKEVILVEGKNDSKKIKKIFPNIETFETNGYDITKQKINLIKKINDTRGIICFLDPDRVGKKIRDILIKEIPNLKHAFITIDDIDSKSEKKGIAEAKDDSIKKALNNFFYPLEEKPKISWEEYLSLDLNTKEKRLELCNKLEIPYYNHKQLFNILNIINISYENLKNKDWNE
ncbi:MAG: ribonuclease M5 [Mycoplasmoidaceae bacterium]